MEIQQAAHNTRIFLKKRYDKEEQSHREATRGSIITNGVPVSLVIIRQYRNMIHERRTTSHITDEQM
jgi:hypothetical protein